MNAPAFPLLLVQLAFGLALAYSCFCRLVKTDAETIREIRWAICFEGAAGLLVFGAPFMPMLVPELSGAWRPLTTPLWVWLSVLVACTLVQVATARFLHTGPPADFQQG